MEGHLLLKFVFSSFLSLQSCPLNPAPELQSESEFSQRFAHIIRGVIDFAGMIPGFQLLTQDDKFTLLKAGLFDALFVRLICMFDTDIDCVICFNGQLMRRDEIRKVPNSALNTGFLIESTFEYAKRLNVMNLSDAEIGLFCAIVLITPDRPGLRNIELVQRMHSNLKQCLHTVSMQSRPDSPDFVPTLLSTLSDLRTLSTLHTEMLVKFRTEHKDLLRHPMWQAEDELMSSKSSPNWMCDASSEDVAKSPMGSVSSTESGSDAEAYAAAQSAPLLAATLSGGCPIRHRASSGSSAEDDIVGAAHLAQNGLTITPVVRSVPINNHIRYRKLDSPTDSGIESGNEKHDNKLSSGSSSCSSPRSSLEDQQDDKRHIVEDMPVLKRVLQAPPLYDTNSLMDEAYKPHKKFRAMRHRSSEAEAVVKRQPSPPAPSSVCTTQQSTINNNTTTIVQQQQQPQSQLHMHLTRPQTSSLSSTHSVLAKSLMQEPQMTPEQIKRSDIIQSYMMREHKDITTASQLSSHRDGLLVTVGQCPYSNGSLSSSSSNSNQRWPSNGQSVITRNQQTPSPSSSEHRYFQSPHSTSTSPPGPSPSSASSPSPRLIELQVDIADHQQPLNLSKKSPSPPPRSAVHKVLLEA